MPRTARIALPNYPHHVIQRGHNRQAVFADPDDYRYYLANLATWKTAYDCKVYAYCLMTNHGEDGSNCAARGGRGRAEVGRNQASSGGCAPDAALLFLLAQNE